MLEAGGRGCVVECCHCIFKLMLGSLYMFVLETLL